MTTVRRLYPAVTPPRLAMAHPRSHSLRQHLVGLWLPDPAIAGRRIRSLIPPSPSSTVNSTRTAGVAGNALRLLTTTDLGYPYLPVAGNERPLTVWVDFAIRVVTYTEFLRQYQTSQPDRMIFSVSSTLKLSWTHPISLVSAQSLIVDRRHTAAATEVPAVRSTIYIDGVPVGSSSSALARFSPTTTTLYSPNTTDVFALAIFLGLALAPADLAQLHNDPDFLTRPNLLAAATAPAADEPSPRRRKPNYAHMPNRPWWRRWPNRKLQY